MTISERPDTITWAMTSPLGARLVIAVHGRVMAFRRNGGMWQAGTYMDARTASDAALEKTREAERTTGATLTSGPVAIKLPAGIANELASKGTMSMNGAVLIAMALHLTDQNLETTVSS